MKKEVDLKILVLLGLKTKDDLNLKTKKKTLQPVDQIENTKHNVKRLDTTLKQEKKYDEEEQNADSMEDLLKNCAQIHKVGENYKTDSYVVTPNTMKLLAEHVKAVGGKVIIFFIKV